MAQGLRKGDEHLRLSHLRECPKFAFEICIAFFQLTEIGVITESGQLVQKNAEEEPRPDLRNVITLPQPMVELIVKGMLPKQGIVTVRLVQLTEDGELGVPGQSALRSVEEELKPGQGNVTTLPRLTAGMTVKAIQLKRSPVTLKTAKVKFRPNAIA